MAKKSMIAKNEQRKVIVERYAEKRLELKKAWWTRPEQTSRVKQLALGSRSFLGTLHLSAFVVATRSMVAPAVTSRNMAFLV